MSIAAMAAISAVPAVFQGVMGAIQARQGRKMAEGITVPEYQIPEAQKQALALARQGVGTFEMPGQDQMIQGLEAGVAGSLNAATQAATSSSDLLSTIANTTGQKMEGVLNIGANAAQQFEQRRNAYQNALNTFATYQEKEQMDKIRRQEMAAAAAAGLMNVGRQNIGEAVKGIAGVGANAMMLKASGFGSTGTGLTNDEIVRQNIMSGIGSINPNPFGAQRSAQIPMIADASTNSYFGGYGQGSGSGMSATMQQQAILKNIKNLIGSTNTSYYDPAAIGYMFDPKEE